MSNPWDPNVIPAELDADGTHCRVGRDKEDPSPSYSVIHQVLMPEWNVVKSAACWMHNAIGTEDLPDYDSLRGLRDFGILEDRSWFFDTGGAVAPEGIWNDPGGGVDPPVYYGGRGGGLKFVDDTDRLISSRLVEITYSDDFSIKYGFAIEAPPAGAHNMVLVYDDGTGNNNFGISVTSGLLVEGYITTGGVAVYVSSGIILLAKRESVFSLRLDGTTHHAWLSVDGATEVDIGEVPNVDFSELTHWGINDATCGYTRVRAPRTRFNLRTGDALP